MTIRKFVDAPGFKRECFKIFLKRHQCINKTIFHNQILKTLIFPGVDINFQVAL